MQTTMPDPRPGRASVEERVVFGTGGNRDLLCFVFLLPEAGTAPITELGEC